MTIWASNPPATRLLLNGSTIASFRSDYTQVHSDEIRVQDGRVDGVVLADATLSSDGSFNFTGLPGNIYSFFRVLVYAGSNQSDGIGNINLALRINGNTGASDYRWNFQDLGFHESITTANYYPVGRLSEGTRRTSAEIIITSHGSWPTIFSLCYGNWGTGGSRLVVCGGTVTDSSNVNRIQIYAHQGSLSSTARAVVIGYQ